MLFCTPELEVLETGADCGMSRLPKEQKRQSQRPKASPATTTSAMQFNARKRLAMDCQSGARIAASWVGGHSELQRRGGGVAQRRRQDERGVNDLNDLHGARHDGGGLAKCELVKYLCVSGGLNWVRRSEGDGVLWWEGV